MNGNELKICKELADRVECFKPFEFTNINTDKCLILLDEEYELTTEDILNILLAKGKPKGSKRFDEFNDFLNYLLTEQKITLEEATMIRLQT